MFTQIANRLKSGFAGGPSQTYVIKNMSTGVVIPLRATTIVGKLHSSDVVLREGLPSRRHALLSLEGGQLLVEDLKSRNGTFVNGFKISVRTKVYGGYRIKFDIEEFLVMGPPEPGLDIEVETIARAPSPPEQTRPLMSVTVPIYLQKSAGHGSPAAGYAGRTTVMDSSASSANLSKSAPAREPPWNYKEKTVVMTQKLRRVVPGREETLELVYVPTLLVRAGRLPEQRFEMRPSTGGKQKWSIGADAKNEIVLNDERVSGKHAVIHVDDGKWKIVDQLSKNRTSVNGEQVVIRQLSSGDRIDIGPVETVFILPARLITMTGIESAWRFITLRGLLAVGGFALTALAIFEIWHLNLWHWRE